MAYYNGFPVTYQPYTPVQVPQQQSYTGASSVQQGSIIWVQGEAGAKSYLVAPNNTVQLWDSEAQTIYLKSADASGMPSMKILDYTIRETAQNCAQKPVQNPTGNSAMTAVNGEIERINGEIEVLKKQIKNLIKEDGNE